MEEHARSVSDLSDQLQGTGTTTKDTFHAILPEAEPSNESLQTPNQLKDPKNVKRKIKNGNVSEETSQPSTSREKMPSTSKESNQSTPGEGILSASKQQDKAASSDWVEAEIVSSRQEETSIVPAREIGQGPIQNQNIEVKKNQRNINVKESDSKGQNNHGHVQHNAAEVQNQCDETLSASNPNKRSSPEIETYQKKGHVQREINKEEKNNVTSYKEVDDIVSQFLSNLLAEGSVLGPSISKENNQSTLGEGIPLISKQQDKAPSKGWVVAEIVISSDEETTNVQARDIGQGYIKNQNTEAKKKQIIIKSDNKGQNDHVHLQHNAAVEKTAPYPCERSITESKTYKRKINEKESVNNVKNSEDQNQRDANLSAPSPIKRPSSEIKTCQKKGNVQRVINKEVDETVSQLLTDVSAEENATKHSNTVVFTNKNKSNEHNVLNGAISEEVQDPQNATASEAFEIVSQLLESLFINLNSDSELWTVNPQSLTECFDLQSAAITVKVDGLSTEDFLTNTGNTSLDVATPSTVDHKENMAPTPENPDIFKVLPLTLTECFDLQSAEITVKVDGLSTEESLTNTGNTSLDIATPSTVDHKENMATTPENPDIFKVLPLTLTECFDLQSAEITVKVDGLSTEESLTNTGNTSLDIATPSTVDHKENMATTPENPDIIKDLPRRSTRRVMEKQIEEDSIQKCEEEETKECQNASNYNDTSEPTEIAGGAEGKSEPRYLGNICEITKKGGGNRRQNTTVRGQILVDTTKRLGEKDLDPRKHFLITFRIHKSFHQQEGQKGIRPGKCQEIDVLNYQTLADLRRKIMCETNFQDTAGGVSSTPVATIAKQTFKSGMFYFNNTFYVDTQEGSEDYSVVIRKWAEEHFIEMGERKPMKEVRVEDLEVRLGCPYVYMHQGSCEHLIIISGARLLTGKKSLYSSHYPHLTKTTRSPLYFCVTCTMNLANWIVIGSDEMTHDTNFMCESCLHSFHYIGTQKVANFKAYHLRQRAILYH